MSPDYLAEVRRLHMTEVSGWGAQYEKELHLITEYLFKKTSLKTGIYNEPLKFRPPFAFKRFLHKTLARLVAKMIAKPLPAVKRTITRLA